ncbi:cell division protein FtsZ [Rhodoligotrophos defluvii]|uniref:cell division protein FtsZ n=1 Tax=Rhodoligotrophos defluvii TaxID=2561934 RepID=UPI0010C98EBD|nr:cell division protein FtsZ [Rhodoligotrophos defluvii]
MTISLTVPNLAELKPRITVFGVGGAGGNAVNNMIHSKLEGVEFVVANTDAQALSQNAAQRRIQMGTALTQGLGAGSQPQIGAAAAEEALPEILDHLAGAHMCFITAGMGGGTGTGAAPVIARAAKEQGILTVGVVTKPFQFEGQRRMITAERGIEGLSKHVDTLIVIPNQNLFRIANEKTTFAAAFAMADQVLYSGVASITELMTKEGLINLDFADVRAVMSEMGKAMMGTGEAAGDKRAIEAAEAAISNPLLDDVSMRGARGLLISITGGHDLTLYEVDEAATRIREEVDPEANIILGATFDESLEGVMRVSVVATGIVDPAMEQAPHDYDAEYDSAPERTSYGYTGSGRPPAPPAPQPAMREAGPQPVMREAAPQPAARPQAPQAQPQPQSAYQAQSALAERELEPVGLEPAYAAVEEEPVADQQAVEDHLEQDERAYGAAASSAAVSAPQPPLAQPQPALRAAPTPPRLPSIEDFPPHAQRHYAQRNANVEDLNAHAYKKRKSLFERLASVGLGRRDEDEDHVPAKAEPAMSSRRDMHAQPEPQQGYAPQAEQPGQGDLDDDQLEIPAFLRRQAN